MLCITIGSYLFFWMFRGFMNSNASSRTFNLRNRTVWYLQWPYASFRWSQMVASEIQLWTYNSLSAVQHRLGQDWGTLSWLHSFSHLLYLTIGAIQREFVSQRRWKSAKRLHSPIDHFCPLQSFPVSFMDVPILSFLLCILFHTFLFSSFFHSIVALRPSMIFNTPYATEWCCTSKPPGWSGAFGGVVHWQYCDLLDRRILSAMSLPEDARKIHHGNLAPSVVLLWRM